MPSRWQALAIGCTGKPTMPNMCSTPCALRLCAINVAPSISAIVAASAPEAFCAARSARHLGRGDGSAFVRSAEIRRGPPRVSRSGACAGARALLTPTRVADYREWDLAVIYRLHGVDGEYQARHAPEASRGWCKPGGWQQPNSLLSLPADGPAHRGQ